MNGQSHFVAIFIVLLSSAVTSWCTTLNVLHSQPEVALGFPLQVTENASWCNLPSVLVKNEVLIPVNNSCNYFRVLRCFCLTVDRCTSQQCSSKPRFIVGKCLYGCFMSGIGTEYHNTSLSPWSDGICSYSNRKCALCGQCREGYGVPAYSFSLKCVHCANESLWTTIPRYVFAAYGPLTLFLVFIVAFTISVNSAPLRGWILVCQILSGNFVMFVLTLTNEFHPKIGLTPFIDLFGTVYGVWNLDFFRSLYKPFCIHPSLTTLQVMALDYIIAAYPLALIFMMYAMVEMYDRNYRPLVLMGRLFHHCFVRFRNRLDIRTSLIDAFGTFFSLSFVKFLSTTANLIATERVWHSESNKYSWRVYFYPSQEPFRGRHVPYAIAATLFTVLCNVLPLALILLHSFSRGQVVLKVIPGPVRRAMYPFIDNMLGCYKDGTNGTRNCRWFAVVYYFALIGSLSSLMLARNPVMFGWISFVCILAGILVAVFQPYKSKAYNTVDTVLTLSVGLGFIGAMSYFLASIEAPFARQLSFLLLISGVFIPLLYLMGYIGLTFYRKARPLINYILHTKGRVTDDEMCQQPLLFNIPQT